ncbi:Holliday junction branch migration protein RuvA [Candidatus Dojkabacteria bacterium]|nr:Holliday junction branch migration protein RuvA [Candidatus Dojkabacteria bacterium]
MIGFIKGKIIYVDANSLIIENNGIGYRVEGCNINAIEGEIVEVFVSTYMRENELKLFGFNTQIDLKIFELLLEVNGVGPKAAILLLGNLGSKKIINAINFNKPEFLKVKGVGQKTSYKIILDLTNKIKKNNLFSNTMSNLEDELYDQQSIDTEQKISDAKEALISLGFKGEEIDKSINKIYEKIDDSIKTEHLVKILLQDLKK